MTWLCLRNASELEQRADLQGATRQSIQVIVSLCDTSHSTLAALHHAIDVCRDSLQAVETEILVVPARTDENARVRFTELARTFSPPDGLPCAL
jgi:esterase/lipase